MFNVFEMTNEKTKLKKVTLPGHFTQQKDFRDSKS